MTPESDISEQAYLHAMRLSIAGEDREMISNALRRWYGVEDPDPIIDRVIGRGSA